MDVAKRRERAADPGVIANGCEPFAGKTQGFDGPNEASER